MAQTADGELAQPDRAAPHPHLVLVDLGVAVGPVRSRVTRVQAVAGSASRVARSLALRARRVRKPMPAWSSSNRPAPVVTRESNTTSSGSLPVACSQ